VHDLLHLNQLTAVTGPLGKHTIIIKEYNEFLVELIYVGASLSASLFVIALLYQLIQSTHTVEATKSSLFWT